MDNIESKLVYDQRTIIRALYTLVRNIKCEVEFDAENPPVYICIMDGAVQFFSAITLMLPPGRCEYIKAHSYGDNQSAGTLVVSDINNSSLSSAKHIFIFDDICDSGATLKAVRDMVQLANPNASVYTVALINRVNEDKGVPYWSGIDTSESTFFAGFGMDNKGLNRNLSFIYDCTEDKI